MPSGTVLSSEWPSLTPHCKDSPSFFAEGTLFSSWYFILKAIIFIYLPVYCVPAPLNNKLRAVGPSLVSDTEILKMNEWSMKTAHQWKLLSMVPGTEHEPEWMNEWTAPQQLIRPWPRSQASSLRPQCNLTGSRRPSGRSSCCCLSVFPLAAKSPVTI